MFSQVLGAQEVRENYNGVRSLGMGGASIALVNDETALLLNPAGLGKLRDVFGTVFDPEIEGGMNLNEMYNAKAFSNPLDLNQVKETTDTTRDKYYHFKGQVFPSIVLKNFGIGLRAGRTIDAKMSTDGTQLTTFYQDDMSFHMGFSLRFLDGRIKVGAAGKLISRIEVDRVLDPTGDMTLTTIGSEGVGIGSDAGLILTAPIAWLPTLSAVVRDVGGTAFTAGSGLRLKTESRPNRLEQDMDVAFALFPIHSSKSRSSFSLQYNKLTAASQSDDKTRFTHVGYEYNYADLLFLRAGMHQRYWTAGLEIASEFTQIQIASYGEEVGLAGFDSTEDRRYIFKFTFRY